MPPTTRTETMAVVELRAKDGRRHERLYFRGMRWRHEPELCRLVLCQKNRDVVQFDTADVVRFFEEPRSTSEVT